MKTNYSAILKRGNARLCHGTGITSNTGLGRGRPGLTAQDPLNSLSLTTTSSIAFCRSRVDLHGFVYYLVWTLG